MIHILYYVPAVPEQKDDSSSRSKDDGGNIAADSSISPYGTTGAVSLDNTDGTSAVQTLLSQRSVHKGSPHSTTTKGAPSPIPPQERGVFRMSSDHKLQVLLTRMATRDKLYTGLEEETPASPGPSPDDWSSKERPTSLPSLGEPPTPPSIKYAAW